MRYTFPNTPEYFAKRIKIWEMNKRKKAEGGKVPYSDAYINERLEYWIAKAVAHRMEGK